MEVSTNVNWLFLGIGLVIGILLGTLSVIFYYKRGLSAQYDYLPDCDKFKIACRPTIDHEQAFCEAVQQMHKRKESKDEWSSAVIYWAAVELGNDLKNYPYQSIKARWKSAVALGATSP